MNFYFDENHGRKIARALNELDSDNRIRHVVDEGWGGASDVTWLQKLPAGVVTVVLTLDRGISKNPAERHAWKESGAMVFFMARSWQHIDPWDQAWKIVRKWPQICALASKRPSGTGFILHPTGTKTQQFDL